MNPASHTAGCYFLLDSGGGQAQLETSLLTKQSHQTPRSLVCSRATQPANRLLCATARGWQALLALLVSAVHPLTGLHWASWVYGVDGLASIRS
jgi:hypothetical protein